MKILLLYIPRCGSTSILRYFKSVRPDYEVINQPWSSLVSKLNFTNMITYKDLIVKENIFVKIDIATFLTERIDFDCVNKDFDKIIILDRKDNDKQVESLVYAKMNDSFLESNKYWFDNVSKESFEESKFVIETLKKSIEIIREKLNSKIYYYEDLYYNDFSNLFNYLEIEYNEEFFKKYLSKENKYRLNTIELKEKKSLI